MQNYVYKSYDEIEDHKQKRGGVKRFIIVSTLALFIALAGFVATAELFLPIIRYGEATRAMQSGDYIEAAKTYLELGDWRDSAAKVDECYAAYGIEMLDAGNLDTALAYYSLLSAPYTVSAERMRDVFYDYANMQAERGDVNVALSLFSGILSGHSDSDLRYCELQLQLGDALLSGGDYTGAYEHLKCVDAKLIPAAIDSLLACRQGYYDALLSEFEEKRTKESQFIEKTHIPEGFFHEMLDGFQESESYRIYSKLVDSEWEKSDHAENLKLAYQLGDFLNTQESGFAMQRLYGRRYSNEAGSYFEIMEDGAANSNLPRYWLSGYYGLYSKIEDGIYYIGSDEARWTKQYSFTFADYDRTLWVYSHSTGYRYMLTLEE